MTISKKTLVRSRRVADRAVGSLSLIVAHELDALSGHLAEARERVAVALKARGVGELIRTQFDLFPETVARLELDQRERRELISELLKDLRGGLQKAA